MITQQQANDFANEWIEAWNSHDIDKTLMHYDDNDIVFVLRLFGYFMITQVVPLRIKQTSGNISQKDEAIPKFVIQS